VSKKSFAGSLLTPLALPAGMGVRFKNKRPVDPSSPDQIEQAQLSQSLPPSRPVSKQHAV